MTGKLKKIECDPSCGFMVRSHDEAELMRLGMSHVKEFHGEMKISEKEMKSMIKAA